MSETSQVVGFLLGAAKAYEDTKGRMYLRMELCAEGKKVGPNNEHKYYLTVNGSLAEGIEHLCTGGKKMLVTGRIEQKIFWSNPKDGSEPIPKMENKLIVTDLVLL